MNHMNYTRRAAFSLVAASLLTTVSGSAVFAQDYTAENPLKVALGCCQTNANQSPFIQPNSGIRPQEGSATRRERRRVTV